MKMLIRSYRRIDHESLVFDEEKRSVDVVASTPAEDSYEEIVEQSWNLNRYKKNPVILYEHGHAGGWLAPDKEAMFPLGHAENIRVENGTLKATLVFTTADINPLAERVWKAFKAGVLRAVSVGFKPKKVRKEKRDGKDVDVLSDNELYEISVVSIPANPEAVAEERSLAIKSIFGGSNEPTLQKENPIMDYTMLAALLGCKADEADVQASIKSLQSLALVGRATISSLGLEDNATEGDVSKSLVNLLAKSAKFDELEPKFNEAQSVIAKRAEEDAERDVAWVIKCGEEKLYGVEANSKMHKALVAYRKSDPQGFADQFAVALKGRELFDNPTMFKHVSVSPEPQSAEEYDSDPIARIQKSAFELQKKLAQKGENITLIEAFDRLARGQE
jgi:HK97 family phage prohead protease